MFRITLLLGGILALAGCACPEAQEVRYAGFDLSTPENALEYFREALLRDDARHQYLVFSEALKRNVEEREGVRFSLANYVLVRDRVRDFVIREIGRLENIRISEARFDSEDPTLAEVDLVAPGRRETVKMVLQIEYTIGFEEAPTLSGFLPRHLEPAMIRNDHLILDLPLEKRPEDPEARIYSVSYFSEWKILELAGSPFTEKVGELLREESEGDDRPPTP